MKTKFKLKNSNYYLTIKPHYCGAEAEGRDLKDGKLWRLPMVIWDIICYEFKLGRWSNKALNA
jgi:hypothetical protein